MAHQLTLQINVEAAVAEERLRGLERRIDALTQEASEGKIPLEHFNQKLKQLSAEAQVAEKEVERLRRQKAQLGDQSTKTGSALGGLSSIITRFAGPAAVGLAIKQTIGWASNLSDLAKKTGISVEGLQRFEHAAVKNGSSIDALSSTIAMLADRIGSGDKSAVKAVQKLGLSFDTLKGQSPEKTFVDLANALNKVPNHYEKVALAQDIFGRGARELIPLLDDVAESFKSDIPVATRETIEALDALDDWWADLKLTVKSTIASMLGGLLSFGQAIEDFQKRHPWLAKLMKSPGVLAAEQFGAKGVGAAIMGPSFQEAGAARGPGIAGMLPSPLGALGIPEDFDKVVADLKRQGDETRRLSVATDRAADSARKAADAEERLAWVRYERSLLRNPPTPAEWALPTPGFTVAGPVAGNPWANLFGGPGQPGKTNPWFQTGFGGPSVTPGWTGALPGQPVSITDIIGKKQGWFSGLGKMFGGGTGLLQGILGSFMGGGDVSKSIGGMLGGGLGTYVGQTFKAVGGKVLSSIGSFLGPLGGILGGALGGLFGKLFGPSEASKTKKARNEWLEQAGGLAEVRKMAEYAGVSIDKLLSTKKTKTLEAEIQKLEAAFKATQERVQALTTELATLAQSGGLMSKSLLTRIKADLSKPEVQQAFGEFITQSMDTAAKGLTGFLAGGGVVTAATAGAFGGALAGLFAQMQDMGATAQQALEALQPAIDALQVKLQGLGTDGGAAFAELLSLATLAKDEFAGPLIAAINDLGIGLAGLHNAGLLTEEMFGGLVQSISDTYAKLMEQGKGGREALILIRKPLQTIWELQQDFGYAVDAGTQALLDQAVEAGLVGDKFRDAQKQMIDALNKLISRFDVFLKQLGVELPAEAKKGAKGANDAIDSIHTPGHGGGGDGNEDGKGGGPSYQHGSGGLRDFGAGTYAILHGREAVLTETQWRRATAGGVTVQVDARGALLGDATSQAQLARLISDAVLQRTTLLART